MNEALTKADQMCGLLASDLQEATGTASPLADIILQQLLRDAVQLGNRIAQLRLAVEAEAKR